MKYYPLLFLSMLLLSSCATITRGVHEKLKVQSDPPGAAVTLSTGEKGVTPATFVEKRRRDTFTVTVSKPGYVSQTVTVQSKAGGTGGTAMAGNLLIGGAIGMGVDAGTGAYDSLYPNPVSVKLVPTSKSKTSKRSATTSSEKPRPKPKPSSSATKTKPTKTEPEPVITPAPPPAATPTAPPTLESSPSP